MAFDQNEVLHFLDSFAKTMVSKTQTEAMNGLFFDGPVNGKHLQRALALDYKRFNLDIRSFQERADGTLLAKAQYDVEYLTKRGLTVKLNVPVSFVLKKSGSNWKILNGDTVVKAIFSKLLLLGCLSPLIVFLVWIILIKYTPLYDFSIWLLALVRGK